MLRKRAALHTLLFGTLKCNWQHGQQHSACFSKAAAYATATAHAAAAPAAVIVGVADPTAAATLAAT